MSFKIIEGLLKTNLPDREKLRIISEVANFITDYQEHSQEMRREGRKVSISDYASSQGIEIKTLSKQDVKDTLEKGIKWLIENRNQDKGWGWVERKRFAPKAWKMLGNNIKRRGASLPWDTAMATMVLRDWTVYFKDNTTQQLVDEGREWLIANQNLDSDGGWGRLLWIDSDSPSNAIETGISLRVLFPADSPAKKKAVEEGLRFLSTVEKKDGGWSIQPGLPSGTKPTAMSIAVNHIYQTKINRVKRGVRWLLKNQTKAGNWEWKQSSFSQIDATFYSIGALLIHNLITGDPNVLQAIYDGVNWYKDHVGFVQHEGKVGWAWGDIESTAAAIATLLNCDEHESSPEIEKGVEWIITQYDPKNFWEAHTPIALLALIRYIKPESRLSGGVAQIP